MDLGLRLSSVHFIAAVLCALLVPVFAEAGELFRYRFPTKDGRKFEYVFESLACLFCRYHHWPNPIPAFRRGVAGRQNCSTQCVGEAVTLVSWLFLGSQLLELRRERRKSCSHPSMRCSTYRALKQNVISPLVP
jgi:hypothetical protein